ncbi:MAG: helix-hairpin-helix domain-containing protein [Phycisphaerales bacterium]
MSRRRPTASPARQRGMILYAVFVVIALATLIAIMGTNAAETTVEGAGVSVGAAQSRSLAWSGVQAAMAELAEQRADLIAGREPVLTGEWELFKGQGASRMVVRLVAIGPAGERTETEGGKLNVNTASEAMLAKVPGMTAELAAAVVAARASRPYLSIADLSRVAGMEALVRGAPADEGAESGAAAERTTISRLLTAISFEPSIQYGVGPRGTDRRGTRRVDVNIGPGESLSQELERRFGKEQAERFAKLFKADRQLKNREALAEAAAPAGLTPEDWSVVLDQFEAGPDPYQPGRIDLNRAPAEVLACIPGIDAERAAKIVEARAGLSAELLAGVSWPLIQGILTPQQFRQALPHLTTRSFQWRVIIEAGIAGGTDEERSRPLPDLELRSRTVLEAVLDIASQRPRIAYLRDITLLESALQVEASLPEEEEVVEPPPPPTPPALPASPVSPRSATPAPPAAQKPDAPPPPPPKLEPVDRRVGRWTAGAQGGSP